MKRVITILMTAFLLVGCGSGSASAQPANTQDSSAALDITTFKTMGDAFAHTDQDRQRAYSDDTYIYVFETNGNYYRAVSKMTPEVLEQLQALDFFDEEHDKKEMEIAGALELESIENLSDQIPSQEELDKYVGKTGQNLLDEGWTEGMGYSLDDMEFWLYHGPFCYAVVFESDKKYENTDDFDVWATIAPLTIKSVKFHDLGDAAVIN
ncbi:MAG: hypothetical protein J6S26_03335 [Solobacterium sp.]|nr:hypothetical protein [Solobacterium sp.]